MPARARKRGHRLAAYRQCSADAGRRRTADGMTRLVIFGAVTLVLAWISRNQLTRPDSHGFYRFGAWEVLLFIGSF